MYLAVKYLSSTVIASLPSSSCGFFHLMSGMFSCLLPRATVVSQQVKTPGAAGNLTHGRACRCGWVVGMDQC